MDKIKKQDFEILNIIASSVDGKIASHSMESSFERNQIGMICNEDFQRMRSSVATCDAVFIGAKSIETEKGAFRVSDLTKNQTEPEWIVFTQSGNISFQHPFWKQKNIPKSIFFVSSFNLNEEPMLRLEEKEEEFGKIKYYLGNILGLLNYLNTINKKRFALLGGGKLNTAFWEQNLVTDLLLTVSPIVIGNMHSPNLVSSSHLLSKKLECRKVTQSGNFVFIDYKVF